MKIGVPKEIKDQEYRVSITPAGVHALHQKGHTVLVESRAGEGSGISDQAYRTAGAKIVSSKRSLFDQAEVILKVKEPLPSEFEFFHPGQILFTYLHLAADRELFDFLTKREVAAIAYETIELPDGTRPLLKPMSEVAGRMSVLAGAYYLQKKTGGMGLLLSGVPGVAKGKVTILGGGVVGKNAAQVALALGANVTVIDESSARRTYLDDFFRGQVVTLPPYPGEIADQVERSSLVIGAVFRSGDKAPHLVTKQMVSKMEKGSVVVDVAIDQGGCFETSRPTSHSDPIYIVHGVVHYCVPNIPGVVPKTSTFALANETFPYLEKLAELGLKGAAQADAALAAGINLYRGSVIHPGVAKAFGLKAAPLKLS
ncbi:MAG TPA: alanine dehydrogenase [Candidatus Manganitrophaceae bacterium]|nr:alanine dehydrogenase [Candidatus Manganitrophaceae bacterium]